MEILPSPPPPPPFQTPASGGGGGAAEGEDEGEGGGQGLVQWTDPFLMCVHHRHSFHAWDPFRAIQAKFFPEGARVGGRMWGWMDAF